MYKTADNKNIFTLLNKPGECPFWYIKDYQVREISCTAMHLDKTNNQVRLYSRTEPLLPETVYSTQKAASRALVKMLRDQIRRTLTNN